jgi:hypothetical protein
MTLLRQVWSNDRGQDTAALPLVAMYWVWKVGFVVWVTNGACCLGNEQSQHTLASDTKTDSCRRCVVGTWPLSKASQGAALLEYDNLHTAIHVSMLHTQYV